MTAAEIRKVLVEVLTEIQVLSGRPVPDFREDLRPLEDIEDFDSLNAEEATTLLCDRLGVDIEENPFVSKKGDHALHLGEMVQSLAAAVPARKGA